MSGQDSGGDWFLYCDDCDCSGEDEEWFNDGEAYCPECGHHISFHDWGR